MAFLFGKTSSHKVAQPKRCFILGRARSGTTVFRRMINSHPAIGALSEIFNGDAKHNYFEFLAQKFRDDPTLCFPQHSIPLYHEYLEKQCARFPKKKVVVFDVKFECMHVVYKPWHAARDIASPLAEVRENKWHLIQITRRNHLRRMISNSRATSTGNYHVKAGDTGASKVSIALNTENILAKFEAFDLAYDQTEAYFSNYDRFMTIDYDSMFVQQGNTSSFDKDLLSDVAEFLKISNEFDDTPREGKSTPQPVRDAISNFDEVAKILDGTRYAWLLQEH